MPLPEDVSDYAELLTHTEKLHQAVRMEQWERVNQLWFEDADLRVLSAPKITDKENLSKILLLMQEITQMLASRKQDIAILLRIGRD